MAIAFPFDAPSAPPAPWSGDPARGPAPAGTVEEGYRYCDALARRHYENFPVVLSPFATAQRRALAAAYAFARTADDFADEPEFGAFRRELLAGWGAELEACLRGEPARHPVFAALGDAVRRFDIPAGPLRDLLAAFRQDTAKARYDTFGEVLDYCERSANPVGRIVLRVLGVDGPRERFASDRICTALQLANFWQDLSVDLPRGRCYLPREDLDRFGVSREELSAGRATPAIRRLLAFELDRTAALFAEGLPLVWRAGWPGSAYLAAVWAGGRAVTAMARGMGGRLLRERPSLGAGAAIRWAAAVWRTPDAV
jgi:squalene synthase HpnC